ncbi:MAG TPA: rhodanese-like domain-containing protein [Candidatus Riflebacteria bacterium]|jgi:phage shock protein E|nr:rhodanese-like domain-containing protein [Candidatus Riflebacteria bacterium]
MENSQLIIIAAIIIFFLLKRLGQISPQKARELKDAGAVIIDVRSAEEYADGHVEDAINVPLDQLGEKIASVAPDRQQALLVYCLSGTRSALARRILRGRQYTNVYNLGSIYRAKSILNRE